MYNCITLHLKLTEPCKSTILHLKKKKKERKKEGEKKKSQEKNVVAFRVSSPFRSLVSYLKPK